jgi:hypothetical protein
MIPLKPLITSRAVARVRPGAAPLRMSRRVRKSISSKRKVYGTECGKASTQNSCHVVMTTKYYLQWLGSPDMSWLYP